jgi:tetratricopeptide (TPR) repeat protein
MQHAMARMQAGAIAADLGRWDQAEADLQAAVLAIEGYYRLLPDVFATRTGLSRCHQLLADVRRAKGDHAGAESSARRAITLLEGLIADYPHMLAFRRYLGQCHDLIGVSRTASGSPSTAGPSFQRAVTALSQARSGSSGDASVKRAPDDVAAERALAGVYLHLAAMHQALGRSSEAERAALQAVEVYEAISVHYPDDRSRFDLAQSLYALGRSRIDSGAPPRSEPPLRRAYQILEKLERDFPCAAAYQEALSKVASALEEFRKLQGQASRELPRPRGDHGTRREDGSSQRDHTPGPAMVQPPG